MLFIFSTTYDTTVDLLVYYIGSDKVFRFNTDIYKDYKIFIDENSFRIEDPTGRSITNKEIKKVLYRKPLKVKDIFPEENLPTEEIYYEKEVWYVMREMINLLWSEEKIVLVEPLVDYRVGKFVQLRCAKKYFNVPKFIFRYGIDKLLSTKGEVIIKSLTSEPIFDDGSVIFATKVKQEELDISCPWFVQEYIHSQKDITVVFVRDEIFAFELDRTVFLDKTIDWRELSVDVTTDMWAEHKLPDYMRNSIFSFMMDLKLHFGRFDFLYNNNKYYFLEINPNGQWAWLDSERKNKLLDKVINEISPDTPVYSIPYLR
ncbi:hypothetical protein Thena_1112 [Thermodesulfobium narugense DSM 14796]|uniref:RimK domain protein ATP-grasp n=1 Tax=Thermodesulfobium narugense DSM 14796 TaxID=747365 RepID=M1E7P2_9BACT|nr:hypothetical protein [Thermodesulfobium narugense]AEE14733.1 hypothetical protein Thena_1112 [Thermodesulfobium narugense DSM 14796]